MVEDDVTAGVLIGVRAGQLPLLLGWVDEEVHVSAHSCRRIIVIMIITTVKRSGAVVGEKERLPSFPSFCDRF